VLYDSYIIHNAFQKSHDSSTKCHYSFRLFNHFNLNIHIYIYVHIYIYIYIYINHFNIDDKGWNRGCYSNTPHFTATHHIILQHTATQQMTGAEVSDPLAAYYYPFNNTGRAREQVIILKSHIPPQFTTAHSCRADFWEFPLADSVSTCAASGA